MVIHRQVNYQIFFAHSNLKLYLNICIIFFFLFWRWHFQPMHSLSPKPVHKTLCIHGFPSHRLDHEQLQNRSITINWEVTLGLWRMFLGTVCLQKSLLETSIEEYICGGNRLSEGLCGQCIYYIQCMCLAAFGILGCKTVWWQFVANNFHISFQFKLIKKYGLPKVLQSSDMSPKPTNTPVFSSLNFTSQARLIKPVSFISYLFS